MAQTIPAQGKSSRRKAKKREQPLGVAIGLGLAATLGAGLLMAVVLFLIPGTAAHQFVLLILHNPSATLALDPLYQQWLDQLAEEDTLFGTPLSLLCGGLVLGWFAPSYVSRRRVLLSCAALGFGVLVVTLAFQWITGVTQQNLMNHREGGQQVVLTAPLELILRQILCVVAWTAVGVFGTWLGLTQRQRKRSLLHTH